MKITKQTQHFLHFKYAPALRSMQDQPLLCANDLHSAAPFATCVANWVNQLKIITDKQLDAINRIIERKRWVEPPRFRPFGEVVQDYAGKDFFRVTACPASTSTRSSTRSRPWFRRARKACPERSRSATSTK